MISYMNNEMSNGLSFYSKLISKNESRNDCAKNMVNCKVFWVRRRGIYILIEV